MTRPITQAKRKEAFMKEAEGMFEKLEKWYDENPAASFEEIEKKARQARRELMGSTLGIMINGRDVGKTKERPNCQECGQEIVLVQRQMDKGLKKEGELMSRNGRLFLPKLLPFLLCVGQLLPSLSKDNFLTLR